LTLCFDVELSTVWDVVKGEKEKKKRNMTKKKGKRLAVVGVSNKQIR